MSSATLTAPLNRSGCLDNSGTSLLKMMVPTRPKYASVAGAGGTPFSRVHFCAKAAVQQIRSVAMTKWRMGSTRTRSATAGGGGAWLRVEGGIPWKVRNRSCQPFAGSWLDACWYAPPSYDADD